MIRTIFLLALLGLSQLDHASAFYYNQYHAHPPVQPVMLPEASDLFPSYEQQQQQQQNQVMEQEANGNAYSNPAALWSAASQPSPLQNLYQGDLSASRSDYYPLPRGLMYGSPSEARESQDVCATGFVEHCLMQANNDGEQRLLASMVAGNRSDEQETLRREFDGMCHVVTRFIECLNAHYVKCSPLSRQQVINQQMANAKDMFAESWSQLCAADGIVRQRE